MIAYWFPPEGNAAAYRPLRFLRNLPASGWTGRVITGGNQFERYDAELLDRVPTGTEVIRVPHGDIWQSIQHRRSQRLQDNKSGTTTDAARPERHRWRERILSDARLLVGRAESWWYQPDMQASWIKPAVEAAVSTCTRTPADVVWATGPPWSAFMVARRVSQRTGIPYVLDFRTSWTIVPSSFEANRPAWAQQRDCRLLR